MSEWWERPENEPLKPSPEVPADPAEPEAPIPADPAEPPAPTDEPTEPAAPSAPEAPYIPNVPTPSTPPTPPRPPVWTPPASQTPAMWPPRQPAPTPYPPRQQPPRQQPPKKSSAPVIAAVILAALCVSLLVIGAVLLRTDRIPLGPAGATTTTTTSAQGTGTPAGENAPSVVIQDAGADDGGLTTTEIVKRNVDSTVVINMYSTRMARYGSFTFNTETEVQVGTASGIVLSEDGYIITNQHVTTDDSTGQAYSRLEVVLYSGATYTATLVGADADTDLAVIKIEATGLKPATFGASSKMNVGDRVVTIGNAGGLKWSASQGILSGTKRDVYEKTGYSIQCLQIDAAINPGNSGGPLINAQGQVIGINSAKIVYEGYESLGFSIPMDEAKTVLDDLIRYGYVTGRVELGIKGYTITQTGYEGFMVSEIDADSSLAGANIQVNDIITSLDGEKVTNRTELRNLLSKHSVGDVVTLGILRISNQRTGATDTLQVKVTLRESRG